MRGKRSQIPPRPVKPTKNEVERETQPFSPGPDIARGGKKGSDKPSPSMPETTPESPPAPPKPKEEIEPGENSGQAANGPDYFETRDPAKPVPIAPAVAAYEAVLSKEAALKAAPKAVGITGQPENPPLPGRVLETLEPDAPSLELETLMGDMRDNILGSVRRINKPWASMLTYEQASIVDNIEEKCRETITEAVKLVTKTKFPHVNMTVDKLALDKGIKIQMSSVLSHENLGRLGMHLHKEAVVILISPEQFFGEKSEAEIDEEQGNLAV